MSRSRLDALLLGGLLAVAPALVPSHALAAGAKKPAAAKKDDKKKDDKKGDPKKDDKKAATERPGDQKASTKGLEEALKKTETEDTRPMAPAKLENAAGKEVTKDAQADKHRDEAIEQIKKILPKQKNPDVRADLLFQLAELWWEKSRFVNLAEEMPAFQKAADDWNKCVREKGEKACGGEPRVNNRKSELYRKNAVDLYSQIIKEYSNYKRLDEVRFILAYNMYDLAGGLDGKAKEEKVNAALKAYRDLITLHPKSPFVADAYTQLGNAYFDKNELAPARKAFEECVKLHSVKTETYCIYKLAWCDINSGDNEMAVKRFKDVIARSEAAEKSGGKDSDKIRLKTEAMRDTIKPFVSLKSVDDAIHYYQQHAGREGSKKYVTMLSNAYFDTGDYETAVKMFRFMLGEYKNAPNSPEWQSKIVLSYDKLNNRPKVLEEMRVLVNGYKPGSSWWTVNGAGKDGKVSVPGEIALALTEEALYNLVTDYHQEAIKTKSVPTYRLARDIYKEYVDNFPDSERAYQMRFYYAEILFALEEFQPAYDQYVKVALNKEREDLKPVSAKNMLICAENLVKLDNGQMKLTIDENSNKKIEEKKDKGQIEQSKMLVKIDKNAKEIALTDNEKQLVTACDRYVEFVPNAPDESSVRLRAAVAFFDKFHYVEAAKRFGFIINKWPEEKTSATAAQLTLEALEVKEEWESLNELSRQFAANQKLLAGQGKDEFKKKLAVYIEGSQFKIASATNEEKKDYPLAAKQFRDFVKEFPKSKYSPIALYNAFVIYQRAKELDTAIEMGEKLLAEYKDCDKDENRKIGAEGETRPPILPLLVFDLAKTYEQTADFATAAKYYEKFASDFPADDRAADAQFNAALWLQGLGESDRAIAGYEKYIKAYQGKKKEDIERLKLPSDEAVTFQIALIIEGKKDWAKLVTKLDDYQKAYKGAAGWKLQNARYKQFLALKELNKPADMVKKADEIVKTNGSLSDEDKKRPEAQLAVAHARFFQLEPEFDSYVKIKFDSPQTLKAVLGKKKAAKDALGKNYLSVVQYGNGDFAIASLVRLAMLEKLFGKALVEAPAPKGLDEDQKELYRAQLEEIALQYEEPAITGLETAMAKSFELGIYNEWTLEAENLLAEFKPDLFSEVKTLPLKGSEFFFVGGQPGEGSGSDAK